MNNIKNRQFVYVLVSLETHVLGWLVVLGRQETNLKSAVCAMVERLDDGVRRLEMASEQGANDPSEMEYIRQDRSHRPSFFGAPGLDSHGISHFEN